MKQAPRLPFRCSTSFAAAVLAVCAAMTLSSAQAQVAVFSTLGPGNTYDAGGGQTVSGTTNGGYQSIANAFTPSASGDLFSIEFGITLQQAGANGQVAVRLFGHDPINNRPNTAINLVSGEVTATSIYGTTSDELTTFTYSGAPVSLVQGEIYWVALAPVAANTGVVWHFNNLGFPNGNGRVASSNNGTDYVAFNGALSAFEVNVIPEPSTYALCATGALLLVAARRRHARRQA